MSKGQKYTILGILIAIAILLPTYFYFSEGIGEYDEISCEIHHHWIEDDLTILTSQGHFDLSYSDSIGKFWDYDGDRVTDIDYALVTLRIKGDKSTGYDVELLTVDGYNDTHFWSVKNAKSQMASFPEKLEIQSDLVFDFSNVIDRYGRAYHRVITKEISITNPCNYSTKPEVDASFYWIESLRVYPSDERRQGDFIYYSETIPKHLLNNKYFWMHIGFSSGENISWHSIKDDISLPEIGANQTLNIHLKIEVHGCDRGTFYDGQDYHFNIFIVRLQRYPQCVSKAIPVEVIT